MPARGHATAPTFDGNPLNLKRFFDEVDLLADEAKLDDRGKIKHSLRYASIADFEIWDRLPTAAGGDFDDFRKAVIQLYPGAEDDRRYSVADLDRLTITQARHGIRTRAELGEYYREFFRIAGFLLDKRRISERERNLAYEAGFDPDLKQRVKMRMQYSKPDHFHDDPYDFQEFHNCAHFLLAGTAADQGSFTRSTCTRPTPEPVVPKAEPPDNGMADLMRLMTQQIAMLTQTMAAQHSRPNPIPRPPAPRLTDNGSVPPPAEKCCYFCHDPMHLIPQCPHVDEYICNGKCIRNEAGRVVLPNGYFIPRHIVGRTLRERFDLWHAQNPGQKAAVTTQRDPPPHMKVNIVEVVDVPNEDAPLPFVNEVYHSTVHDHVCVPDDNDCEEEIQVLEAELQKAKSKRVRFNVVEILPCYSKGKGRAPNPSLKPVPSAPVDPPVAGPSSAQPQPPSAVTASIP